MKEFLTFGLISIANCSTDARRFSETSFRTLLAVSAAERQAFFDVRLEESAEGCQTDFDGWIGLFRCTGAGLESLLMFGRFIGCDTVYNALTLRGVRMIGLIEGESSSRSRIRMIRRLQDWRYLQDFETVL